MTTESLTAEQQAFLEECMLEFSDRYTDSDIQYKKIYDAGIPPPPIMCPWFGRPKLTAHRYRDRAGGSKYDRGGYQQEHNFRDRDRAFEDNYSSGGSYRQQQDRKYR